MNFGVSARLTDSAFFVIEADEYDTAFFDKRSKFVHYRPRTAILNNLEYDHADIFPDLAAIETQFHHLSARSPARAGSIVNGGRGEPRARARARLLVARSSASAWRGGIVRRSSGARLADRGRRHGILLRRRAARRVRWPRSAADRGGTTG